MANKHKEHKHHKLVGYWTRVVVFELLCLLWTTLKITLLCFHWTALKTLLTSHSRKIANIIRRGVIYIFLLICVSLLNSSCGHWTVCFYWTMHTKSKTNLNSAEDATREPHVKVLQVIYHWSVHLSSCSPAWRWPASRKIYSVFGGFRIVSSSDSQPEDDLYVRGFTAID